MNCTNDTNSAISTNGIFNSILLLLVLIIPLVSIGATAVPYAHDLEQLKKCYNLFTSDHIDAKDSLWIAVQSGKKTGTQACMEIFDHAALDKTGRLAMVNGKPDPIGLKILRNFSIFLRSQIASTVKSYESLQVYSYPIVETTDLDEPVMHHLYSVFKPGEPYSKLVTRNYTFYAERTSTQLPRTTPIVVIPGSSITLKDLTFYSGNKNCSGVAGINTADDCINYSGRSGTLVKWEPRLVQTGLLYGMAADPQTNVPPFVQKPWEYSVNHHFGAGAIGTQTYLRTNIGFLNGIIRRPDGGLSQFRPFGKHLMSDFLCREIPTLRPSDVSSQIHQKSILPFRLGFSCMGCHATQDPLVGVIRNLELGRVRPPEGMPYLVPSSLSNTKPSAPHPTLAGDADYYKRPTEGKLYYRGFDGTLYDVELNSLVELGDQMAKTKDLYACAAKRYYYFLTGIKANLEDLGNFNTNPINATEKLHRDFVIKLGDRLQNDPNQSVRSIIEAIIDSRAFTKPEVP